MNEETLYKRDLYLNRDLPILIGKDIYEYDMHRAGFSITKEYQLLPKKEIARLEKMLYKKQELSKQIGLIQRANPEYKKALANGFVDIRRRFFEANELLPHEILSIKKDAIFTLKPCESLTFGEVSFACKNHYTSFIYLKRFEFYYNLNTLDIKGISDERLKEYETIIDFLKKFFYRMEYESKEDVLRFLRVYIDRYKRLELDVEYYRPFNGIAEYVSKDGNTNYSIISPEMLEEVDISWNYLNLLIPLLGLIL